MSDAFIFEKVREKPPCTFSCSISGVLVSPAKRAGTLASQTAAITKVIKNAVQKAYRLRTSFGFFRIDSIFSNNTIGVNG